MTTVKDIQINIHVDFDAVSLWIGSFGGEDSACDISRGVFAAKRGIPRLLDMFKRFDITTTFNVTGHSMESFPKAGMMIIEAGHELGIHGYLHENPLAMNREQETAVLEKSIDVIKTMSGQTPRGYIAPWWELSPNTIDLLLSHGIEYDGSIMEDDFHPHYLRRGDSWTKIDYTHNAEDWMKPWVAGEEVNIVEIPASWHRDDAPATTFVKKFPNSHGWVTGQSIGQIWQDQFDWIYQHHDYAVFPLVIHPDSAGHPHVLMAVERFIEHTLKHAGVRHLTLGQMADDFRRRVPFGTPNDVGGVSGL